MKRLLDLSSVSTPQLLEIKKVLSAGVLAQAEIDNNGDSTVAQLCHKSPPKGYPKEKGQYGDPECYRYPINTKTRCLTAWRYVHQEQNKSILGGKFKKVESKIRSYAKKHYNLDLQVGESEELDWEQIFMDYYDAETMGERCELIDLEPEDSDEASKREVNKTMEDKERILALEQEIKDLKVEKETWSTEKSGLEVKALKEEKETFIAEKAELETKASQVETLTKELSDQKEELETLRKFKTDTDESAEKADKLKGIKAKLDEAKIDADIETEADYWLSMTEDTLDKTIAKMGELKKGAQASASIKVPPVGGENESDARTVVSDGFKELRQAKGGN